MSFKIYTKTGDEGNTSLIGGTRIPKAHIRIESYGTVDELNSCLGVVSDTMDLPAYVAFIKEIQDRLFTIGSALATDPDKDVKMRLPDLTEADIALLEKEMDKMDESLPALKSFILPGGHIGASHAHVARCVCRRAERICVHMQIDGEFMPPHIIIYLNRLSDFLFTLARFISHSHGVADLEWHPRISE
jgi:cob(I)alamin adenosyltransferase